MKSSDTRRNWDYGQVDLTTAATIYPITNLHGGESITIKARGGNSGMAYIGSDRLVLATNGFELDSSETLTLTLPITFGIDNYIEIFATTDNSGDDICWVKLIGLFPQTVATTVELVQT